MSELKTSLKLFISSENGGNNAKEVINPMMSVKSYSATTKQLRREMATNSAQLKYD